MPRDWQGLHFTEPGGYRLAVFRSSAAARLNDAVPDQVCQLIPHLQLPGPGFVIEPTIFGNFEDILPIWQVSTRSSSNFFGQTDHTRRLPHRFPRKENPRSRVPNCSGEGGGERFNNTT